jgi:hypothetical protein
MAAFRFLGAVLGTMYLSPIALITTVTFCASVFERQLNMSQHDHSGANANRMWIKRPIVAIPTAIVATMLVEFFLLEGTLGVSLPKDRYSATSTLQIEVKGANGDEHFITRNNRFTVVNLWMGPPLRGPLVLRESLFVDKADGVEGPPDANITVEAMVDSRMKWTFRESGERGDVVTDHVYKVTRFGNGETGNTYTYFSLLDGHKVQTNLYTELSTSELIALDRSVANN